MLSRRRLLEKVKSLASKGGKSAKWTVFLYVSKLNKTITQNNDQQRIEIVSKWLNLV